LDDFRFSDFRFTIDFSSFLGFFYTACKDTTFFLICELFVYSKVWKFRKNLLILQPETGKTYNLRMKNRKNEIK